MQVRLVVAAALTACSSKPSRLDHVLDKKEPTLADLAADPWGANAKARAHDSGDDDDKGFDLQGAFAKIKDSIDTPGPYEMPAKSKDFDEAKPHWGVLKIHGGIVEREAFSFTGGHGTELRQLVDRLRALAKDPQLAGM